jgi:hypothetical protein
MNLGGKISKGNEKGYHKMKETNNNIKFIEKIYERMCYNDIDSIYSGWNG